MDTSTLTGEELRTLLLSKDLGSNLAICHNSLEAIHSSLPMHDLRLLAVTRFPGPMNGTSEQAPQEFYRGGMSDHRWGQFKSSTSSGLIKLLIERVSAADRDEAVNLNPATRAQRASDDRDTVLNDLKQISSQHAYMTNTSQLANPIFHKLFDAVCDVIVNSPSYSNMILDLVALMKYRFDTGADSNKVIAKQTILAICLAGCWDNNHSFLSVLRPGLCGDGIMTEGPDGKLWINKHSVAENGRLRGVLPCNQQAFVDLDRLDNMIKRVAETKIDGMLLTPFHIPIHWQARESGFEQGCVGCQLKIIPSLQSAVFAAFRAALITTIAANVKVIAHLSWADTLIKWCQSMKSDANLLVEISSS